MHCNYWACALVVCVAREKACQVIQNLRALLPSTKTSKAKKKKIVWKLSQYCIIMLIFIFLSHLSISSNWSIMNPKYFFNSTSFYSKCGQSHSKSNIPIMLPGGDLLGPAPSRKLWACCFHITSWLQFICTGTIFISVYICTHLLEPKENFKEPEKNRMLFRDLCKVRAP